MRAWASLVALAVAGAAVAAQAPVFRSSVDIVQLDVAVFDKARAPIRGLTAADFIVTENGQRQSVMDAAEIVLPDPGDASAAWLHLVPPDIKTNTFNEQLIDGQIVVIVFDDAHLSPSNLSLVGRARDVAYDVVERLSGLDVAAVVSTQFGMTEPFTNDRDRLRSAIASYSPHPSQRMTMDFTAPSLVEEPGGARPERGVVGRNTCERDDPTIPSLVTLTESLAQIPQRRKTVILISTGDPDPFTRPAIGCASMLAQEATSLFWQSQRANVNIHAVDPTGLRAPETFVPGTRTGNGAGPGAGNIFAPPASSPNDDPKVTAPPASGSSAGSTTNPNGGNDSTRGASGANNGNAGRGGRGRGPAAAAGIDSLSIIAESTGGEAIVRTDKFASSMDRILSGNRAYYLVGYRTTHTSADGKYRRISVEVRRPGATVLTRRGYFGPSAPAGRSGADGAPAIAAAEASRLGVSPGSDLVLRTSAAPIAHVAGPGGGLTAVALTLGIRVPSPRAPVSDVLGVITSVENAGGTISAPVRQLMRLRLDPNAADSHYEITWRVDLPPGRQSIRVTVHSGLLDKNGTVYMDLDVPDLSSRGLAIPTLVFGPGPAGRSVMDFTLEYLLPLAPTTGRQFSRGDKASVYCPIFGVFAAGPVSVRLQVVGVTDALEFEDTSIIAADRFDATGAAQYRHEIPTARLAAGMHLLDVQAQLPDGTSARRSVPFQIK